jgi:hypothetical protein
MSNANKDKAIKDRRVTRLGTDRRKFQYSAFIPERRTGKDRRSPIAQRSESES